MTKRKPEQPAAPAVEPPEHRSADDRAVLALLPDDEARARLISWRGTYRAELDARMDALEAGAMARIAELEAQLEFEREAAAVQEVLGILPSTANDREAMRAVGDSAAVARAMTVLHDKERLRAARRFSDLHGLSLGLMDGGHA
jgi:hypothetical protein